MVHSQLDRSLLFPPPKSRGSRVVGLRRNFMQSSNEKVIRSSSTDRVLVIMAKAPRLGAVKTRLTPGLSPQAVSDFYCCLLYDTLALAGSLDDVEVAVMCPESDVSELTQ